MVRRGAHLLALIVGLFLLLAVRLLVPIGAEALRERQAVGQWRDGLRAAEAAGDCEQVVAFVDVGLRAGLRAASLAAADELKQRGPCEGALRAAFTELFAGAHFPSVYDGPLEKTLEWRFEILSQELTYANGEKPLPKPLRNLRENVSGFLHSGNLQFWRAEAIFTSSCDAYHDRLLDTPSGYINGLYRPGLLAAAIKDGEASPAAAEAYHRRRQSDCRDLAVRTATHANYDNLAEATSACAILWSVSRLTEDHPRRPVCDWITEGPPDSGPWRWPPDLQDPSPASPH